ncbi:MAG TPA: AlpA family phage regulatory protein [Solirubrobacteraceae bacterium]|nr:AlpA family phage regulatory protein [Solirubrobacteraceae bacterium]
MTITAARLLRLPAVLELTGLRTTSIYGQAKVGLFPPPVKLTERCSAWPEHEVAQVNAARIAGKSAAEIRQLVARLVAERQQTAHAA